MIELKAELLKKKEELKKKQQQQQPSKRPKLNDSQLPSHSRPAATATLPSEEESLLLERSKRALEAKSRLYAKLERGRLDEKDLSPAQREGLLVDFTWKGWNADTGEYELPSSSSSEEELDNDNSNSKEAESSAGSTGTSRKLLTEREVLNLPAERDLDWIEMIDDFGRHRVLRPADLKSLHRERSLCQRYSQEWEQVRNKGVGFYAFSAEDEGLRERQMEALRALRAETLESRTRALLMREQRRIQLERRLATLRKQQRPPK